MKRTVALVLAGYMLLWPAAGLRAEEQRPQPEKPEQDAALSREDRQVIKNMELLALLDLLKDMDLLSGETRPRPEDKQ